MVHDGVWIQKINIFLINININLANRKILPSKQACIIILIATLDVSNLVQTTEKRVELLLEIHESLTPLILPRPPPIPPSSIPGNTGSITVYNCFSGTIKCSTGTHYLVLSPTACHPSIAAGYFVFISSTIIRMMRVLKRWKTDRSCI